MQQLQDRQDISAIDSSTQKLNSSLEMLSQQQLQDRQELDSRIQEVNSSLEMQQLQDRLDISTVDSRTQEINSSVEMLSQQLLQEDSDINRRIEDVNASLSQQVNNVQIQADQTVSRLEMLGSLETFPAPSCSNLLPSFPSGHYRVGNSAERVFCDMGLMCGGVTGWARVAQQDFSISGSDPCPSGFSERNDSGIRTCQANSTDCTSIDYSTFGITYSSVCGRAVAYQFGTPEAFSRLLVISSLTIDSQYLDGLSLTHGENPRHHIWSFAAAVDDARRNRFGCPCNTGSTVSVANTFIGTDYFCDTATASLMSGVFFPDDPLWDGAGCRAQSADCCSLNTPPWFYRQLPQPTSDDIEIRSCQDESTTNEGTPIESIEIYVR